MSRSASDDNDYVNDVALQIIMNHNHIGNGVPGRASKDKIVDEISNKEEENRKHTILLVGKCQVRETGNSATLYRLRLHVESAGYECVMLDPDDLGDHPDPTSTLRDLIRRLNIECSVGLHLYRSASILLTCKELGVPYICYFGGTDINEGVKTPEVLHVMTEVVFGAKGLMAFTRDMKKTALRTWLTLNQDAIKVLPQAITINPNMDFDLQLYISQLREAFCEHGLNSTSDSKNKPLIGKYKKSATTTSGDIINYNSDASNQTHIENVTNLNERKFSLNGELSKENLIATKSTRDNSDTSNQTLIENVTDLNERKLSLNGELSKENLIATKSTSDVFSCPSCTALFSFGDERSRYQLPDDHYPLVVLIAGLRPVKDVMFVADVWSKWQRERGDKGMLLIIGPILDAHYAQEVIAHAARLSGVLVADKLEPSDCQEVIRAADVLINTSISEGMSAAILEAMALGTPVLARDIPGNAAVISHGVNGLLFTCPDSFLKQLQRLLHDPELSSTITANAKRYIHLNHCPEVERRGFLKVLHEAMIL